MSGETSAHRQVKALVWLTTGQPGLLDQGGESAQMLHSREQLGALRLKTHPLMVSPGMATHGPAVCPESFLLPPSPLDLVSEFTLVPLEKAMIRYLGLHSSAELREHKTYRDTDVSPDVTATYRAAVMRMGIVWCGLLQPGPRSQTPGPAGHHVSLQ
ncbi:hypothetical protein NQZ68_016590 [Dissostichus eleginoides]|nr:hypothetical protein NQZ68_016590 [Dissostichus eleginoides]